MKLILRPHQARVIQENKHAILLAWDTRTGKTLAAIEWAKQKEGYPRLPALIVVPKNLKTKWTDDCVKYDFKALIVSKEVFKIDATDNMLLNVSSIIIDEAHHHSSALFVKPRSRLAVSTYEFLQKHSELPRAICTATPTRSSPWNLHTLMCYIGEYKDWKKWREYFFEKVRVPYANYPIWQPKKNWRVLIRKPLEKYADIVLYRDCIGMVPKETEEIERIKTVYPEVAEEWTVPKRWHEMHRAEAMNEAKIDRIIEIGQTVRKMLVVCYYRDQIPYYAERLAKDKRVYVIDGRTKDGSLVAKEAHADDECYLICQSSCAAGWEFSSASVAVFATMDFSYLNYTQTRGRLRNVDDPHPIIYYHLIGGKYDKAVYDRVSMGKDFDVAEYTKHEYE